MPETEQTPSGEAGKKDGESPSEESLDKLRGEIASLEKALADERRRANEYLSRLQYLQADFENYLKKVEKDFEEKKRFANEQLILKLLNVVEDLEKAVSASKHSEENPLHRGVKMVLRELKQLLQREGLSEIDALGQDFDPRKHEAVGQVETDDEEGKVIRELRKGYMLHGKVLRPSMVEVAKKKVSEGHT
ncbi:MAG: nucleotide exchange factor GrpE [Candidatus Bathyarchaeia archaeon]